MTYNVRVDADCDLCRREFSTSSVEEMKMHGRALKGVPHTFFYCYPKCFEKAKEQYEGYESHEDEDQPDFLPYFGSDY
tara:strand:+ start:1004 stop:1237 length:234 start_codon:yes stop_codon:yes gene_type:complete